MIDVSRDVESIKADVARQMKAMIAVLEKALTAVERATWEDRLDGLVVMSKAADEGHGYVVLDASGYLDSVDRKLDRWNDRRAL